ncbi:hypothetical protein ABZ721_10490 [Streptomyces sp. NPDC006733]|uniref:hypothetical protein n=1 Tax=Streptomyces sp. NPDC006733 TaxID=3155460 RepID=UPI0033C8CFDF
MTRNGKRGLLLGAVSGAPAAAVSLAAALVAIDAVPFEVTNRAIRHAGILDELVQQIGIVATLALCAAVVGAIATWRQGSPVRDAQPGSHRTEVRATGRTGSTQTADRKGTVPVGSTGWPWAAAPAE